MNKILALKSYITLLKSGFKFKKIEKIQKLGRAFENHFLHSFGPFEHVSDQHWIYEQNDSDLNQCEASSKVATGYDFSKAMTFQLTHFEVFLKKPLVFDQFVVHFHTRFPNVRKLWLWIKEIMKFSNISKFNIKLNHSLKTRRQRRKLKINSLKEGLFVKKWLRKKR